jgi:hypothetical protein
MRPNLSFYLRGEPALNRRKWGGTMLRGNGTDEGSNAGNGACHDAVREWV